MKFMVKFKEDMEKTMGEVRKDIDEKLETKLIDIEKSIEKNAEEMRANDTKQTEVNRVLEKRLDNMEIDINRIKFGRMESKSLKNQLIGRNGPDHQKKKKQTEVEREVQVEDESNLEDVQEKETLLPQHNAMARRNSWAEEVEREEEISRVTHGDKWEDYEMTDEGLRRRRSRVTHDRVTHENDADGYKMTQEGLRKRSNWADGLQGDIREAAGKQATYGRRAGSDMKSDLSKEEASRRMDGIHRGLLSILTIIPSMLIHRGEHCYCG